MTPSEIEEHYTHVGRPKPVVKKTGERVFGRRGTGKIAAFKVAAQVRLDTRKGDHRSVLSFKTAELRSGNGNDEISTPVEVSLNTTKQHGTRLTLSGFTNTHGPPTPEHVHDVLLRHFHHLAAKKQFSVNGKAFKPQEHAEPLRKIESVEVEHVGLVSGEVLLAKRKIDEPGLVVYEDGQAVFGPTLCQISTRGTGEFGRTAHKLIGRLEVVRTVPGEVAAGEWNISKRRRALEQWAGTILEEVINKRIQSFTDERVDSWLNDATTRRYYEKLSDPHKAVARRLISNRARKAGDGAKDSERIITRLIVRALASDALTTVLDILEESSDEALDEFGALFRGRDRWNLRQITRAASLVKMRMKALDDLATCSADYKQNEDAMHEILAENPWILADEFHSFRSNKSIRTTLREKFEIDVDDPLTRRRPDFFFVLGNEASNGFDPSGRYLLVELKGPDQPLSTKAQTQVTDDMRKFLRFRGGEGIAILIGTEFNKNNPPDEEISAQGTPRYTFRSYTYEQIIRRARFRLQYMSEGVAETGAETLAREVLEREVIDLVEQRGEV